MKHNGKPHDRDRLGVALLACWRALSPARRRTLVGVGRVLAPDGTRGQAREWVTPKAHPHVIGGMW